MVVDGDLKFGHEYHRRQVSLLRVDRELLQSRDGDGRGVVDIQVCDFKLNLDVAAEQAAQEGQETTPEVLRDAGNPHALRLDSGGMRHALYVHLLQRWREVADGHVDHQRHLQYGRGGLRCALEAGLAAAADKALRARGLVHGLVQAGGANALADIVHSHELVVGVLGARRARRTQVS